LEVAEGAVFVGQCVVGVDRQGKTQAPVKTASASAASVTPPKPKDAVVEAVGKR
jgi:hypothetical protein